MFTMVLRALGLISALALGCNKQDAPAGNPEAQAAANKLWEQKCTTCHGPKGWGDGPAASALNPKPRAFNNAKWQQDTTDAHLRKVILEGGAAVGLSEAMAPNPELQGQPEVLEALVALVRTMR